LDREEKGYSIARKDAKKKFRAVKCVVLLRTRCAADDSFSRRLISDQILQGIEPLGIIVEARDGGEGFSARVEE